MNNARKNKNNKQTISFVLPCYNEEGNLLKLYTELNKVTQTNSINYEFIFVDDGSSDSTLEILQQLCEHDSRIRYISFSRNFGHQQALKAGIAEASGDAVIMMDTDLQHPPVIVPLLIEQWEKGYDVAYRKLYLKNTLKIVI